MYILPKLVILMVNLSKH